MYKALNVNKAVDVSDRPYENKTVYVNNAVNVNKQPMYEKWLT